ncbi:MAG TPA: polysaccharide deacetylase family protein [Terriglobia bacterium]|nr:polysaccharide deacetylase family protein [Terriglobia bacterium]
MSRRFTHPTLSLAMLVIFLVSSSACGADVAITMDDFRFVDSPLMTGKEQDEKILRCLEDNKIQAALFVIGSVLEQPLARERLALWDRDGYIIGNHTYNHEAYEQTSFEAFSRSILQTQSVLARYGNFQKLFRFPALQEGETREKRDQMRAFLKAQGYRQGYVTIDASDWYIDGRLVDRLKKDSKADLKGYRDYYLKHIWDRAQYYDGLSNKVLGRSVKHTLLIHHNQLNALFLNDLIVMFRSKGWRVIPAREAFQDPVFQMEPDIVPAGQSILWALAKATGRFDSMLRDPGEDGVYEKPMMDKLGL